MRELLRLFNIIFFCLVVLVSNLHGQYESPLFQTDYAYNSEEVEKYILNAERTKDERVKLAFQNAKGEGLRQAFCPHFANLYLGKDVDATNEKLYEIFTTKDKNLKEKYRLNDPWCLAFKQIAYHMYYAFGSKGRIFPGRLYPETERALLELLWEKTKFKNDIHIARESTWWMVGSENHDIVSKVGNLLSAQIFMNEPEYRDRIYPDLGTGAGEEYWFHHMYGEDRSPGPHGRANNKDGIEYNAADHYKAWVNYFERFFSERAKKGFFLEMASYGYMAVTVSYLTDIFDLVEDSELKQKAELFLDLVWADWAQEQLVGVRGGGKTREKDGSRWKDSMYRFASFYSGGMGESSTHFFAQLLSKYNWKPIIWHLALNREGRGEFASIRRQPGEEEGTMPRPLGTERTMLCNTESRLVRYSWITPDYIMGCQMDYPLAVHSHLSIQNRWQGVIFKGIDGQRVFPTPLKKDDADVMKPYGDGYTRCVQDENVLIVQQSRGFTVLNPDWYPSKSRANLEYGVYFGNNLDKVVEKEGWIFVQHRDAFLAVRPVMGEYAEGWTILKDESTPGNHSKIMDDSYYWSKNRAWIIMKDKYAGVIFEASRRKHYKSLEDFISAILRNPIVLEKTVVPGFHILRYTGLNGKKYYFNLANNEIPMVDSKRINYAPEQLFNSPFVNSKYNSGIVVLRSQEMEQVVDLNE